MQAGQSIAFPKQTIEDAPVNRHQDTPLSRYEVTPLNRNQEKKKLADRLQEMEDRKRNEEHKLMEEYDIFEKKKSRYSPGMGGIGGMVGMGGERNRGKVSGKR